jgi:hypothetical protein
MSGDHNQSDQDWRKRQIALDIKADNARELGLDYEPDKTIMDMARESWIDVYGLGHDRISFVKALEAFAELVRADEREKCAREFDLRAKYTDGTSSSGWYEPDEPAQIIRRGTTPPAAQPTYRAVKTFHEGKPVYVAQPEQNFCPRCGKRAGNYIHTCTPPQEKNT